MKVKLRKADVTLGEPIPWNVYSSQGMLLLKKGLRIHSEEKLDQLLVCELFRDTDEEPGQTEESDTTSLNELRQHCHHPFDAINHFAGQLDIALERLKQGADDSPQKIRDIASDISRLTHESPDCCLGAAHLYYPHAYSLMQPIYSAIMCTLTARVLNHSEPQTNSLCAAALTANLGMLDYQDQFNSQPTPLTDKQRQQLRLHPQVSVKLLKASGVVDNEWLEMVLQHHERADGNGYPSGIDAKNIHPGAKIISLADSYLAMISERPYRPPVHPNNALKEIYKLSNKDDQTSFLAFIKTLGIFPPGTYVKLENGEIAVVTARSSEDSLKCKVISVCDQDHQIFSSPVLRDTSQPPYAIDTYYEWNEKLDVDMHKLFSAVGTIT
jgi:hypothetical protein